MCLTRVRFIIGHCRGGQIRDECISRGKSGGKLEKLRMEEERNAAAIAPSCCFPWTVSRLLLPLFAVLAVNVFRRRRRIHAFLLQSAIRALLSTCPRQSERTRTRETRKPEFVQNRDAISRFPVKLRPRNTPEQRKFTAVRKFVYAYCNAPLLIPDSLSLSDS